MAYSKDNSGSIVFSAIHHHHHHHHHQHCQPRNHELKTPIAVQCITFT